MLPICHNSQNISIEKKSELLIRPKKFRGMPWVPWYFARMLGLEVPNQLRIAKADLVWLAVLRGWLGRRRRIWFVVSLGRMIP